MAKKKKTATRGDDVSLVDKIKEFSKSNVTHYIVGLVIFCFAFFAVLSIISFFFTHIPDDSVIHGSKQGPIQNWTGLHGAVLSDVLMNEWFGVSTIFLLIFVAFVGLRLMKAKYFNLLKNFIVCSMLTIWTSVALSFLFEILIKEPEIWIGGGHGHTWSEYLNRNFGGIGAFLILLIVFVIIVALVSRKSIFYVMKLSKKPMDISIKKKEKSSEQVDEPEEEEPFVPIETEEPVVFPRREQPDNGFIVNQPKDDEMDLINLPVPAKNEMGLFDPTLDLSGYKRPSLDLLKKYDVQPNQIDMEEQNDNKDKITRTLENYNIRIKSIKATVGPTITLYEIVPEDGVKISKIRNLEDDIAMNLAALGIRIIAPMPGKGTVGIEVPNKDPQIVSMHSIIASRKYQESNFELPIALGKTITNEVFMVDLTKMPHLLVAGATGQGKSVGLNAAITSLLYKKHPAEVKFVMIDPKMVEFNIYSALEKHFLAKLPDEEDPIVTDFTKVVHTLNSLTKEMDDRYKLLNLAGTRNVKEYNEKFINRALNPLNGHRFMPYIVVIIDEFGDLIMTAGKEIELPIARIAQKARAVGIHMIIATQRPTTNIITGTIKANFPARVAFRVISRIDSSTILDSTGANQLIGRGDLLFTSGSDTTRVQCAFVDTPEVERISEFIGEQRGYPTAYPLPEYIENASGKEWDSSDSPDSLDPLFKDVARLVVLEQAGSTSNIQRKLRIGYNRAGSIMDQLERTGIVGPNLGSKPREVLVPDEYHLEMIFNTLK
jgi:S-DNA-T family DNA segregation ATPase FtsK/SpoIIIE